MNLFKIEKPFILTIFGASGDLAKLKLFPALYSLAEQKRLPKEFYLVGYARTEKSKEQFKKEFIESIEDKCGKDLQKHILNELADHVHYYTGQYDNKEDFAGFRSFIKKLTKGKELSHIAYFSVPPQAFKPIIQNLGETKKHGTDERIVIEKPFGQDTESANELFHFIARYFDENHTYLLDHYLGKSAVQSILHLRHSNRILNLLLKGPEIANIQITAFEDVGVENRIGYFEQVGIIKDMIQSHLLQMLALTTMSIPITESADSLHREKNNILSSLNLPKSDKNIVIGQYESYHKQKDVPAKSKTETFAAIRFFIDRESWYKVPIYIRTGKKLNEKHTYIAIEFKKFAFQPKDEAPNLLIIEQHPGEKITIRLINKNDFGHSTRGAITTSESIACDGDNCLPEHSLLLLDVIRGRKNNFLSFPEIIAGWQLTEAVLDSIKKNKIPLHVYKDLSEGPKAQHSLTALDGFTWHDLH